MPFALFLLGVAVFAQGTSEFMLSGLMPDIARELGVSVGDAGLLTSGFAVGMVVGAPLMAGFARRWPWRLALPGFLGVFLCVHVVGATTGSFPVLLGTRVVGALANAGFLAVALVAAVGMVAPDAKGRATSTLLGGVTLACVVGVPAGALLGQVWGWRSAFWAVAALSVPAVVGVMRSVPDRGAELERPAHETAAVAGSRARPVRRRRVSAVRWVPARVRVRATARTRTSVCSPATASSQRARDQQSSTAQTHTQRVRIRPHSTGRRAAEPAAPEGAR
ncbi:putative MFS family arabinose efflux permease [Streptomyces sp. SAI-144]|nr:putative MFS family arabinose efflux permease [Streptomyces sp. SAI-144]MDH6487089.1 putative MFS family arabinose efflux permease [Streptomyces sp. SAI-127]